MTDIETHTYTLESFTTTGLTVSTNRPLRIVKLHLGDVDYSLQISEGDRLIELHDTSHRTATAEEILDSFIHKLQIIKHTTRLILNITKMDGNINFSERLSKPGEMSLATIYAQYQGGRYVLAISDCDTILRFISDTQTEHMVLLENLYQVIDTCINKVRSHVEYEEDYALVSLDQ